MRTTLTIDERIGKALRKLAAESGKSFKEVVNETLSRGLSARSGLDAKAYREKPRRLGGARPGIDLTKALTLAGTLEDEELVRKLEQRR